MSDEPIVFDYDNPEWTEADFARARPIADHPVLAAAFARSRGPQRAATKQLVSLRLDPDIVAHFRAGGRGWQSRLNATLRKALGLV